MTRHPLSKLTWPGTRKLPERAPARDIAARLGLLLPPHLPAPGNAASESSWLVTRGTGDPAGCDFIYAPDNPDWQLGEHALYNALLSLSGLDLDFVIISSALTDVPQIGITSVRNNTIFSRHAFRAFQSRGRLPAGALGRVLRILPGPKDAWTLFLDDPNALEIGGMLIQGADLHLPEGRSPQKRTRAAFQKPPNFELQEDGRRRVLVLPIFMAVGGAERNLLQVMGALKDRFSFVVVTTEPVTRERGSLNHRALEHCERLFDLGEVAPPSEHLRLVEWIAKRVNPDLVFIANGSPWLAKNAEELRALFADIPVVDQQVYDAKEGWIQHFKNPGIRSADRFVAINQQIAREFEERFEIQRERIDLIYHAVDTTRFNLERRRACEAEQSWRKAGLDIDMDSPGPHGEGPHIFGQVARLTPQKRPLDFLELARRSAAEGREDLFVQIGDGELAAECDAFIEKENLANTRRIAFHDDMSQLYPALSGIVFTSAFEGLPVVLLEALCMGVPVLSTAVGDIRIVLEKFGGGVTVDPGAGADELFDAFNTWRSDLSWLHERARNAAPRVTEQFNATSVGERYAQSWERAFQQLANTSPGKNA